MTIFRKLLLAAIGAYQKVLSPFLPANCRFYPSCSEYAAQSVAKHGALRGTVLSIRRLSKCHPWHEGGVDVVE